MKLFFPFVIPNPASIFDVVRFYQRATNLYGMTFYTFSELLRGKQNIRVTTVQILNFVRLILLELAVAVIYSQITLSSHSKGSYVLTIGPRFILVLSAVSLVVISLIDAFKFRLAVEIFQKIHAVDERLHLLKVDSGHAQQQNTLIKVSLFIVLVSLILHVITTLSFIIDIRDVRFVLLVTVCSFVFNTSLTLTFGNYLIRSYLIATRFQLVNQVFSARFDISSRRQFLLTKELPLNRSNDLELVGKLADIHADLSDTVDLLGEIYWVQTNLIMVNVIGTATFSFFSMFRSLLNGEGYLFSHSTGTNLWGLFYLTMLVTLLVQSFLLGWYANRTTVLIYKALNNTKNERLVQSLRYFARQIQDRPVVARFKTFDGSLQVLLSIMGTIGTYLVILFQFDDMIKVATKDNAQLATSTN
ncbi:uncharacterized protein LOC131428620 [Malaya genurostris]|uniref:uncharacterized protein LOC131428620 n=1 Tax=Malaya genurostris TaxID=325434 RepID=UPI0026F405BD|nr:uncharacterized protein LOC131428620 [Malaya genurostris]